MKNDTKILNAKFESLNTERGKILATLKTLPDWREYRFRMFVKDFIGMYFTNGKIVKQIIRFVTGTTSGTITFETLDGIVSTKQIKNIDMPYESTEVFNKITEGGKKVNLTDAKSIHNTYLENKIKEVEKQLTLLKSQLK